jgi:hypothetical protein
MCYFNVRYIYSHDNFYILMVILTYFGSMECEINKQIITSIFSCINHIGGGVCVFTGTDLPYTMYDVSQFCIKKTFEVCATQLDLGEYYIIIICIYR